MPNPALAYAETQLGVHNVFEEALGNRDSLDALLGDLDKAHDTKRTVQAAMSDREFELLTEERGKHHEMSATALDQHMKQVKWRDEKMKDYRLRLDLVAGEIQGLEYDAEMLRITIRILTARMEELGGYLHYLGAVKQAETTTKQMTTTTQSGVTP